MEVEAQLDRGGRCISWRVCPMRNGSRCWTCGKRWVCVCSFFNGLDGCEGRLSCSLRALRIMVDDTEQEYITPNSCLTLFET